MEALCPSSALTLRNHLRNAANSVTVHVLLNNDCTEILAFGALIQELLLIFNSCLGCQKNQNIDNSMVLYFAKKT